MRDYPSGPAAGQVKVLSDPDENGRYTKASVLVDGLPFPSHTEICPVR